ncbi:MAG: RNA polymerase sporulation sigma factor SigK [Bacilli bacterium]|nr:RNA polymerase sporulation sigma factor SigK [Bacilli bacterium]
MFFLMDIFKNLFCFTGSYSVTSFPDPLSSSDEEKYIKLKMNGDCNARNKLVEHNLRLVAHIIKKYESKFVSNDDLISIGTIGLIKGVDTYSPDKGVKITTYCAKCIENEILMYFRTNNKYSKDVSMNEVIGYDKDGGEISIIDVLQASSPDFLEGLELKENISLVNKYLDVLSDREKEVIIRRYGLFNRKSETQKVISKKIGISRSYVSRIEKKALEKILGEFIKNNKVS